MEDSFEAATERMLSLDTENSSTSSGISWRATANGSVSHFRVNIRSRLANPLLVLHLFFDNLRVRSLERQMPKDGAGTRRGKR